ncbi:PhoX family protein [Paenibacillus sedimenti]|uniref:DUF839 domain-containing protein n=1 Tax=Paenibacillus sedimenti TaxID=2770274 RepID=A0A926KQ30_9BACL|nr:alkaline phosphatase PhoX [Paenibacillus sedimenti]MBD0381962.1 DUF839 domain-containing protein [Paenibacillus sedimenti]
MDSKKAISRRAFLGYLGTSAATVVTASSGLQLLVGHGTANAAEPFFTKQTSVLSSLASIDKLPSNDKLNVSSGFTFDVIASYGDIINSRGDTLGYENAGAHYFPIDGSSVHGLLTVSHDSSHAMLAQEGQYGGYSAQQIRNLLTGQGLSVLEVYRDSDGRWKLEKDSAYTRRVTGLDPVELTGPAKGAQSVHNATRVQGTLANRAVTATLWGTALSGEGAYDQSSRYAGLDSTHYGWMTEIDPFDAGFKPRKHTALGRFHHAGTVMKLADTGQLVVYMGDSDGGCLFKFVSRGNYEPAKGRDNAELLTEGTLYAAQLSSGTWIPLHVEAIRKELKRPDFVLPRFTRYSQDQLLSLLKEEADVYVYATEAALILGGTPLDRQGDFTLGSADDALYISFINNEAQGNVHGKVVHIEELNGAAGDRFELDIVVTGGRQSGFSSPRDLTFDRTGRLWVATDIAPDNLHAGTYQSFGNNGLYVIAAESGSSAPSVTQFASAPAGAAFAGPAFVPNEQSLFVSVQHPSGGNPSSVVAIRGHA